jgi:hypothetical protein
MARHQSSISEMTLRINISAGGAENRHSGEMANGAAKWRNNISEAKRVVSWHQRARHGRQ